METGFAGRPASKSTERLPRRNHRQTPLVARVRDAFADRPEFLGCDMLIRTPIYLSDIGLGADPRVSARCPR
jgi:hypothetical protein